MKKKRIMYLDVSRSIAIILISLNHAVNRAFDNYNNQLAEYNTLPIYMNVVKSFITVLSHLGVPLFLMITGTLLLSKRFESESDLARFYKHNVYRIFVTSELWIFVMYWGIVALYDHTLKGNYIGSIIGLIKTLLFIDPVTFDSIWYIPMILTVYLMIPIFSKAIDTFSLKAFYVPLALVIISAMLIPNINTWSQIFGSGYQVKYTIYAANLFSMYFSYTFAGYWISNGGMEKLKDGWIILINAGSLALMVYYQLRIYSSRTNSLLDYDFVGFLICAASLFELIKRKYKGNIVADRLFTYLSSRAFAIYFIHIIVMTMLKKVSIIPDNNRLLYLAYLEIGSIVGSLVIIKAMSISRTLRKYMLYM